MGWELSFTHITFNKTKSYHSIITPLVSNSCFYHTSNLFITFQQSQFLIFYVFISKLWSYSHVALPPQLYMRLNVKQISWSIKQILQLKMYSQTGYLLQQCNVEKGSEHNLTPQTGETDGEEMREWEKERSRKGGRTEKGRV